MPNLLRRFLDVRKQELPLALLMFAYFFFVITIFWILKPIKKALFIQFYGETQFQLFGWMMNAAQAELLAKLLNMLLAIGAVIAFSWLARRFRRQNLSLIVTAFCLVCIVTYTYFVNQPGDLTAWTLCLYGDLFNTLMVPAFFAFLNDSVTAESAKRLWSDRAGGSDRRRFRVDVCSNLD